MALPPLPVPPQPPASVELPEGLSVTELAKAAAPAAIKALCDIGHDPDLKPAARVAALNAIIDRAEGKVGTPQGTTINYNTIITQINRAMGVVDPDAS